MSEEPLPRVLCVDDEPLVLDTLRRTLRNHFEVVTADRPSRALAIIQLERPFDVVLSDLQMPMMNGIELLRRIAVTAPDTARVLLTGNADMNVAIESVNRGQLHHFLLKPCPRDELIEALNEAVLVHRRKVAERDVLDQTLRTSVEALTEVLALANPRVFARASRIAALVHGMVSKLAAPGAWEIEVAAMLSQLGALGLPGGLQDKLHAGDMLTDAERVLVERVPRRSVELLGHVPRLELVRECIIFQLRGFDGSGPPEDGPSGADIPLGSRMLRIAADFDALVAHGFGVAAARDALRGQARLYDPELLDVVAHGHDTVGTVKQLSILSVPVGSILANDVRDGDGVLLVGAGQPMSHTLLDRLQGLAESGHSPRDIWVRAGSR